jgi:hypothetical protein
MLVFNLLMLGVGVSTVSARSIGQYIRKSCRDRRNPPVCVRCRRLFIILESSRFLRDS